MVTIIVPVYNVSEFLPQCLQSIKEQTYRDIEILLIDDGSSDASGPICDHWAEMDSRFRVRHQFNKGPSAARNSGLEMARGEFVCFVDSDDQLHPDMIKHLVTICGQRDVAMCKQLCDEICKWEDQAEELQYFPAQECIERMLYQKSLNCSPCSKLFRTSLFDDMRFKVGTTYEDLDLIPRVIEKTNKEIVSSNQQLYFYRQERQGSILNTFSPRRLDVLNVVDDLELHYSECPELERAVHDRKFAAYYNIFAISKQCGISKYDQNKCWEIVKKYRWDVLFNPSSRAKNKIGAFVSLFGSRFAAFIANFLYK